MPKLAVVLLLTLPVFAGSVPTQVTVRVIARDAKAVYEAVGGAFVTIHEAGSNKVLASGLHTGKSSGSTDKIMIEPRKRGELTFATPDAAVFTATIALERPTVVDVVAEGPVAYPQARASASKTLLLVPGQHITGDGIVLEVHGLIVVAQPPQTNGDRLDLEATVRMACGCPIEPGGIWNADEFDVTARRVGPGGSTIASAPMTWNDGRWRASIPRSDSAPAAVEILAGHTATANFGIHTLELP